MLDNHQLTVLALESLRQEVATLKAKNAKYLEILLYSLSKDSERRQLTYRQALKVFQVYANSLCRVTSFFRAERKKQILEGFQKEAGLYMLSWSDLVEEKHLEKFLECCCKYYYVHHIGGTGEQEILTEFFLGECIRPTYPEILA